MSNPTDRLKLCADCKKIKHRAHYSLRQAGSGNWCPLGPCKPCMVKRTQKWAQQNKKRWRAYHAWYQAEKREEREWELTHGEG